jgi:opacity protein-like surface antigen
LNYGAGVRYRLTPRWMVRVDYRETLISQPDFWSKSRSDILNNLDAPDYTIQEVGPNFAGAMRQQHVTAGVSFTF